MIFESANDFVCRQLNVKQLTIREAQMIYALIQLKRSGVRNFFHYLSPLFSIDEGTVSQYCKRLCMRGYFSRDEQLSYSPTPKAFDYVSRIDRYIKHKRLANMRRYRMPKK